MRRFLVFSCAFGLVLSFYWVAQATEYGGVDFPDGEASFADEAVSYTAGDCVSEPCRNTDRALGPPDFPPDGSGCAYSTSLGTEGELVLKFTDNSLTTSGDATEDLWIFEIGAQIENMNISISTDGITWIDVGDILGQPSGVDIDAYIGSGVVLGEKYSYVRILDLLPETSCSASQYAGADIDAVGAISSVPPTQGACCLPDGSCTEGTEDECNTAGGTYQGDGTECASVICPPPPPTDAEGWRRKGYDLGGTSYYPFPSLPNSGQLNLLWQSTDLNNAAVLTADLDDDGVLDIVASDGSSLIAYDGHGNVLWSVQTSAGLYYIGDLDGDSQPEVCVTYKDGANHLKVDVYNADGTFDKTLDRGPSGYDSRMVVLTHFGDYVVVGYAAGYSLSPRGVGILRYSSGGEEAYFATGGGGLWGTFALGDSDNDGLPEIALPWGTPHNGASANGTTDFDLYAVLVEADITVNPATLNAQFIRPISTLNPSTNPNGYDSAMMPDLDGNGASEILFLEGHDSTYYPGSHYVYNVSSTGVLLSTWKGSSNGKFPLGTVINDLNGDGIKELVMSARDNETLSVVDGSTFSTLMASSIVGRVLGATDFDGDGQDEVIVHQSGSGNVEVLDVDGATLSPIGSWNVGNFTAQCFYVLNRFAISDVTGDGKLELILGASNGLYVLESVSDNCMEGFFEQPSYGGDCENRPSGTVCIGYDDGYIWLVEDSVTGWGMETCNGYQIQLAFGSFKGDYYHILNTNYVKFVPKPTGACCLPDGSCTETAEEDCAGIYKGDGTDCGSVTCQQPPDCSEAYANPDCLWPADHKFVDVSIIGVTDPDGDPVTITINAITSDEPTASDKGSGGEKHAPDASGIGTDTASVRAERSGTADGRVYVIHFTASDGQGGECEGSVTVNVPHDQSYEGCPATDSGQDYDATGIN